MASSHDFIVWLIIGLIAGALAGRVVEGNGFGCLADTVIGLAGALVGGFIFKDLGITPAFDNGGVIWDIVISFVGAVILLGLVKLLTGKGRRGGGTKGWRW